MSSPRERLQKIREAYTPSEVRFKPTVTDKGTLFLNAYKVKEMVRTIPTQDEALHKAFEEVIHEDWDVSIGCYRINDTVEDLWRRVKGTILREYETVSARCQATKRKTESFINYIQWDDKHLANYLLQLFIVLRGDEYEYKSNTEKATVLEPLEALRRTYGKR